jgi:hypothetical protein
MDANRARCDDCNPNSLRARRSNQLSLEHTLYLPSLRTHIVALAFFTTPLAYLKTTETGCWFWNESSSKMGGRKQWLAEEQ